MLYGKITFNKPTKVEFGTFLSYMFLFTVNTLT